MREAASVGRRKKATPMTQHTPLSEERDPFAGWRSDLLKAPRDGSPIDILLEDGEPIHAVHWGEPEPDVADEGDDTEGWLTAGGDWARSEDQRVVCWRPRVAPTPVLSVPEGWKPIDTAPRNRPIRALFADGEEDEIRWEDARFCMIGPPQGSYGPGWVDTYNGLPLCEESPLTHWREVSPTLPDAQAGGWRTIETVDRDGPSVDLWTDRERRVIDACWGCPIPVEEDEDDRPGWLQDGQYALGEDERATHWRPTPSPPKDPA